jgi:uncharacterized surface protein with fasciclin (FAS1) repeats
MKKNAVIWSLALLAVAAIAASPLTAGSYGKKAAKQDIVDTAVAAGSFNTLVAAVQAAELVDALKADGPITVFAPTDEAFARLPEGTVENLLKPENKDQLIAILTYHVVPGKLTASDVTSMSGSTTLQGDDVTFKTKDGKVFVDGAQVVQADVAASNGVIHIIDQVILPGQQG